jgi:hypothetical protein
MQDAMKQNAERLARSSPPNLGAWRERVETGNGKSFDASASSYEPRLTVNEEMNSLVTERDLGQTNDTTIRSISPSTTTASAERSEVGKRIFVGENPILLSSLPGLNSNYNIFMTEYFL